jgi:hypothetical protein
MSIRDFEQDMIACVSVADIKERDFNDLRRAP